MQKNLAVSSSPHLRDKISTQRIMQEVCLALAPAGIAGIVLYGAQAAVLIAVSVITAVLAEFIYQKLTHQRVTVGDWSAVVTGLLLAFNLPATMPLWQAALGGVVAIVVAKQMFGGLGQNFVNPALAGRIVLMASFPEAMNNWVVPLTGTGADAVTSATPLAGGTYSLTEMFFGIRGGCLGETCAMALILGGLYLVVRRVISPAVPLIFIGTVFVLSWLLGEDPVREILSGGLMLGAIFMATDYTTSPINKAGKVVFALGCGALTVLIRQFGSLPEGVSFAVVIMNILVPLIERATRPIPFGEKRRLRREQ